MEAITLDPDAVASDRVALEINDGPITVRQEGIDWGNAEIEAVMADQDRGSSPIDYRLPNRQVVIPLRIREAGQTSFDEARAKLQKKVGLIQREGGWIGRVVNGGGTIYGDVVNASLKMSGGWLQAHRDVDVEAELTLEVIPDFYEDEIALSDHTEATLPEIKFTEGSLRGDYPARVRLIVDDDAGTDQSTLLWSMRSRHYSSAATAAAAYEAEALEALDAATKTALTGASGGTVVQHASLAEDWTSVVGTDLGGTADLTHTGSYKVYARVYSTSGTAPGGGTIGVRMVWDVGDLVTPTTNDEWLLPTQASQFYIADLGEVRLDRVSTGEHRWGGQIQARGQGGTIAVDRVWFFNTDEGHGIAQSAAPTTGLSSFAARDDFSQSSGTLTGKVLPTGGTWSGAGDADGFGIDTAGHTAQRTATTDGTARFGIAGTATYTAVTAQADVKFSTADGTYGALLRYTDVSNYAAAVIQPLPTVAGAPYSYVALRVVVAGAVTNVGLTYSSFFALTSVYHRLKASVDAKGNVALLWGLPGYGVAPVLLATSQHGSLATGGTLASGNVGIFDYYTGAAANTRNFDNFLVRIPTPDAAIFASQSAELSTKAILREDSTGTAYGPVSTTYGDLPRLPVAGMDERITEVMVKASRGDLADSPDSAIDDISARCYYRPSWLYVPD